MGHRITVQGAIACVQGFATGMPPKVNASALRIVPGIERRSERGAELVLERLVNKGLY